MKKSLVVLNLIIVFSIFCGCSNLSDFNIKDLRLPNSLTVKANPTYDFSLGDFDFDLKEYADPVDIITEQISSAGISCYDYNPGELSADLQQIIMKKVIQEIPIDMNSYFKNSSITDQLDNLSVSQEIEIPDITLEDSQDVDLSLLNRQILDLVVLGGLTSGGQITIEDEYLKGNKFDTMSFSSGTLVITTINDYSGNTVTISYNNEVIASGNFTGNTAYLDLAGKTLYLSGMEVDFSPKRDGTYWIGKIDEGQISKVTGLALSGMEVPVESTINTAESFNSFESCTVGEGDVKFSMTTGDAWKNITVNYPITISGAINGESVTNGTNEQILDLSGKTVEPKDTNFSSTVTVSCKKNGVIDFSQTPVIKTVINITEIDSISVLVSNLETSKSINNDLPEEFIRTVKEIDFGQVLIPVTYTNTLPEGNDVVSVDFVSKFLGIKNSRSMECATEQGSFNFENTVDSVTGSHTVKIASNPVEADEYNSIDFSFDITLPGTTSEKPDVVTLKNVKPGDTYKFEVKLNKSDFDPKWNKIVIDTSDYSQNDTIDTNFNIGSVMSSLSNILDDADNTKCKLGDIDFYLFASKPESLLKDAKFTGNISIYTDPDNKRFLLGNASSKGEMTFSEIPDLEYKEDVVVTDISSYKETASAYLDLADVINSADEDQSLCVDYDLNFSSGNNEAELTITPDMLEDGAENNIVILAYIVIPFKFGFNKDATINVSKLANLTDGDVFNRNSASDSLLGDNVKIKDVKLNYASSSLPFKGDISIKVKLYEGNEQTLTLSEGEVDIPDVDTLLSVYPLEPEVLINIPASSSEDNNWISLKRDLTLSTKISFGFTVEGKYVLKK